MAKKKLGDILVEWGLITEDELDDALGALSTKEHKKLGEILIEKGYSTDIDIAQTLAFQFNIPFKDLGDYKIDSDVAHIIDWKLAKKHLVIPIEKDDRSITIATSDPFNKQAEDDVRFVTNKEVKIVLSPLSDILKAINKHYNIDEPLEEMMVGIETNQLVEVIHDVSEVRDVSELLEKSATPPIIKMVDTIIIHAAESNASDIHIEPRERCVQLRLRIDGLLKNAMELPKWVQAAVVSRIKLMAKIDISERRISQDGRIKIRLAGRILDLRVSTLPTQYGETVVMRVLEPKEAILDIESLGLCEENKIRMLNIIERPQGVVLVTGPTGSGKTSTLYAMIQQIKRDETNIITIEDPIEYELFGVNQVPINEKTGQNFAFTLRSVLRQDPDVIFVGETRDNETALIVHQAAQTGHLVFSTLHTNDAVSTILRLNNMEIPSYLITSALNGVVAQRLVRKTCSNCKEEYLPDEKLLKEVGLPVNDTYYKGMGCLKCKETGYNGRVGLFEVLTLNNRLKDLINNNASEDEIRKEAIKGGLITMLEDGVKKVKEGTTTIEEIARIIHIEKTLEEEKEVNKAVEIETLETLETLEIEEIKDDNKAVKNKRKDSKGRKENKVKAVENDFLEIEEVKEADNDFLGTDEEVVVIPPTEDEEAII